jgi:hypothetical protein
MTEPLGISFKDALTMCLQQADAVRWYWNFFFVVAVGLVGLLAGVKTEPLSKRALPVLVLGFIAFAAGNLSAIDATQHQRIALRTLAVSRAVTTEEGDTAAAMNVPSRLGYVSLHIVCDLLVCLALVQLSSKKPEGSSAKG